MTTDSFTPPAPLNTAVLFLVFNRLDTTKQVFAAIKQAKPPRLYIAADGARTSKEGEAEKVNAVRDFILQNIDWECEVETLLREENLGCKYAVSGAIDWFFEQEEMGIILEDDCLPSQSFFWFCEELLERYKDDMRVWHIGGSNFQDGIKRGDGDYYFSKYGFIWGWAAWRRAWNYYDPEIKTFPEFVRTKQIKNIWNNKSIENFWISILKNVHDKKIDTWDYQWSFTLWSNGALSIVPNVNLISNIGFGVDATHTTETNSLDSLKVHQLTISKSPEFVLKNIEADFYVYKNHFKVSLLKKVIKKFKMTVWG